MSKEEREKYIESLNLTDFDKIKAPSDLGFINGGSWSFPPSHKRRLFGNNSYTTLRIYFLDCPCNGVLISGRIHLKKGDDNSIVLEEISFSSTNLYTLSSGDIVHPIRTDTIQDIFNKIDFCKVLFSGDEEKKLFKILKKYKRYFYGDVVIDILYRQNDFTMEEAFLLSSMNRYEFSPKENPTKEDIKRYGEYLLTSNVENELREKARLEVEDKAKIIIQEINKKYGTNYHFEII